jgi:hypothetical protein
MYQGWKKKERKYKGNNGGEREAGHHRHRTEEKTTMVWPRQEDARGENIEINFGMGTRGDAKKEDVLEKHVWKEYKQP